MISVEFRDPNTEVFLRVKTMIRGLHLGCESNRTFIPQAVAWAAKYDGRDRIALCEYIASLAKIDVRLIRREVDAKAAGEIPGMSIRDRLRGTPKG